MVSRVQEPSLARGAPTPSLEPRRTPTSRDKRPSASIGLGGMGEGCDQMAYVRADPKTPQSHPHHCEDPPVLPSVKGSPFTDGRTGGRPPGDAFCPSCGWLVWGQEAGPRRRRQALTTEAPLGAKYPTLEISDQVHRVPGLLSGKWKPSLPPRGPRVFPLTTPPCSSPTPAEEECLGRPGDLGAGQWAGHGSAPGGSGPGGGDPRPGMGSPSGTLAWAPTGRLRALLGLKLAHPASKLQTWTQAASTLSSLG